MNDERRILISTWTFPPTPGGTPVILYELLRHLPPEAFVAFHGVETREPTDQVLGIEDRAFNPTGSAKWSVRMQKRLPRLYTRLLQPRLERYARETEARRIYAHYPDSCYVTAAWQTAEKLDLPLTVYFDILWEEHAPPPGRSMAREFESKVVHRADQRFAITEFAAEYLGKKHGVEFQVIPHTIAASGLPDGMRPVADDGPPIVHFSGAIYEEMNLDSVARLIDAAELLPTRPTLDFYTGYLPPEFRERGLTAQFVSRDALAQAQSDSTILYTPLAFESDRPVMVRNNFPTKTMEYLCSGRPILVHAPPDSYLTWLAEKEGFALVVSDPDPQALADGIDQLAGDKDLQAALVERALAFVQTRDSKIWAEKLWSALNAGTE